MRDTMRKPGKAPPPAEIRTSAADDVLGLKSNSFAVYDDAVLFLDDPAVRPGSTAETVDADHGRIETRRARVFEDVAWLAERHGFPGLAAIAEIVAMREGAGWGDAPPAAGSLASLGRLKRAASDNAFLAALLSQMPSPDRPGWQVDKEIQIVHTSTDWRLCSVAVGDQMTNTQAAEPNSVARALQGLKVIECATVIAAPLCGRLLSDFGAEVIHIEHPQKGDHLRYFGFTEDGINPWFSYYNRNKKLITLDISKKAGREILIRLLAEADIFIENFRPGRLEEWGIEYGELAKSNPRLVMLRVTGYGQYGPYSQQPGFGTIMEAMSGFAELTGEPDRPPILPQFALADSFAGCYAAMAAMFAIYHRDVAGAGMGQVIDVSILESLFSMLGPNAMIYQMTGKPPKRMGNRVPTTAPRNTYRTKDNRWVAIAGATQTTAARMFSAMGRPELISDPRFETNAKRLENVDALDQLVGDWIAEYTRDEITAKLHQMDVPFGPVNDIADITADMHARAREMIIEVSDESGRPLRMEGVFPKMTLTPGEVRHPGARMGADNEEIFVEKLGMSEHQLAEFKRDGVI